MIKEDEIIFRSSTRRRVCVPRVSSFILLFEKRVKCERANLRLAKNIKVI